MLFFFVYWRVYGRDLAIVGVIAGIGSYEGNETINAQGRIIVPGFIDGHVHIESSMLTPKEFAKVVLQHGITAIVTDPHEIGNVAGTDGIQFMLDDAKRVSIGCICDVIFLRTSHSF